jgi:hypothetical protein
MTISKEGIPPFAKNPFITTAFVRFERRGRKGWVSESERIWLI